VTAAGRCDDCGLTLGPLLACECVTRWSAAPAVVYVGHKSLKDGRRGWSATPRTPGEAAEAVESWNRFYSGKVHHFLIARAGAIDTGDSA
jgi:hypothetical protein